MQYFRICNLKQPWIRQIAVVYNTISLVVSEASALVQFEFWVSRFDVLLQLVQIHGLPPTA